MSHYFPMPAFPDAMPVDISFVFDNDKPAGKHGFLKVNGETMCFEDGTPARFWGVNLNGSCCFPDKKCAEDMARRLAQTGCNVVRLHQIDAEFGTPNIFQFTKGQRLDNTRTLDPRSLERMDYLCHCLKEEGIYIYMDLLVYRQFKAGDGVVDPNLLVHGGKPWAMVDRTMIELQKEYAANLFNHVNPYTGLAYKDDPAVMLVEIYAECDLFNKIVIDYKKNPYYAQKFREMFRDWLVEKGLEFDWEGCDLGLCMEQTYLDFKMEKSKNYFREMYTFLRELGVKIPINGTNWIQHNVNFLEAQEEMDFTEAHPYVYIWNGVQHEQQCITQNAKLPGNMLPGMAKMSVPGKPLFMSEWGAPWPNPYRAEATVWFAAVSALQGWTGCAIHTYAYNTRMNVLDPLGRESSTVCVGNSSYRGGIFTAWNDWAQYGLFYHSALILRRGDVRPADKKVAIAAENPKAISSNYTGEAVELCKVSTSLDGTLPEGYDELVKDTDHVKLDDPNVHVSCTGQLRRHLTKGVAVIDTERTKVVYGNLSRANDLAMAFDGVTVTAPTSTSFGVLAISSLTDAAITQSDNLLLSAIGRVRNEGQKLEGDTLCDSGTAPIMAELIRATVSIRTPHGKDMKVWGVNAEGLYVGMMPTKYEDGVLTFTIGDEAKPACYYLVFKE